MTSLRQTDLYLLQKKLRSQSFINYKAVMTELFQHHCKYDFVRKLQGYFRSGDYDKALLFADFLSEQMYSEATMHFVANQFALLIRKYPWDPKVVKTDPESKALAKFYLSERKCYLLNKKFSLYDKIRSPHERSLSAIRSFINHSIGGSPDIDEIIRGSAFGAGASIGVHGRATNLQRKILSKTWSVSPGASVYGYWAIMTDPYLRDLLLERKDGYTCLDWSTAKAEYSRKIQYTAYNKLCFVPKTASTHRAIAVEPLLNGFIQKGTDEALRKRLLRIGIDLSDQSLNQRLARKGSVDDSDESFVTIDLSSASDSISIGLVRNVLPPDWFDFLNSIRSHSYRFKGVEKTYNKFCSMGNGFCFPLETLLFVACCHVSGCGKAGTDYSVYGDDIIVKRKHAFKVLSLLKVLGFTPNIDKTFLEGPFRESCGSDWFEGIDVRPYTLDYSLDCIENLFKWLNLTRRNQLSSWFFLGTESIILRLIPQKWQFWRPFRGNPDSGIDAFGSEYLTSPNCRFNRRELVWKCKELRHTFVPDKGRGLPTCRRDSVDMYALLSGVRSLHYSVGYSFRLSARTSISFTRYSSATSMWLPRRF